MVNQVNSLILISVNLFIASGNLIVPNVTTNSDNLKVSSHHHHHHPSPPLKSLDYSVNKPSTEMTKDSTSSSNHNQHLGMDTMMRPYFHSVLGDTILIKGWELQSSSDVVIACLVFFLLAIVYEGLKSFRELLFRREARSGVFRLSLYNPTNECPDDLVPTSGSRLSTSFNNSEEPGETAIIKCSMWSKAHLYQSVLHAIQVVISYTLMLGFMTFNSFICISIVIGAGLGYFLFCWRKSTFINVTDHCN